MDKSCRLLTDGYIVDSDGFIMFTVHVLLVLHDDLGHNLVFANKIMIDQGRNFQN